MIQVTLITQTQLQSFLTHRTNFITQSQHDTWGDYVLTIATDLDILNFPYYDLDYFLGTAEKRFYMPTSLFDAPEFLEFRTYLENTLQSEVPVEERVPLGELEGFFERVNATSFELQRYHRLVLEQRSGSSGDGCTITGNEIEYESGILPLPILGSTLIQTINSLTKRSVEMRFKIEKAGALNLGYCNIGIGEPSSNDNSEIKYCISMTNLNDKIHYGTDADNLMASPVTHDNSYWYGIAYTDENSVVLRYSADNCATWTEIYTFEDVNLPETMRALFNGQVALLAGNITIKGPHIVAWAS